MSSHPPAETVRDHYDHVAINAGSAPSSTMPDLGIRELETATLLSAVRRAAAGRKLRVLEIGCGNGYTASRLMASGDVSSYVGVDFAEGALRVARARQVTRAQFQTLDLATQAEELARFGPVDVVVSQRVLINMNPSAHGTVLRHITNSLGELGVAILIEGFIEGHRRYNGLRVALGMDEIAPAWHNSYLSDTEFHEVVKSVGLEHDLEFMPWRHFLSSHYLATRVLSPLKFGMQAYAQNRNDHRIQNLARAVPPTEGFSPLELRVLRKA